LKVILSENIHSLPELTHAVCKIAMAAAGLIMDVYKTDFVVKQKDDRSPLTMADMASHKIICEKLTEVTPDIPILSEESTDIPFTERNLWTRYWLVDPLDGTREFVKRNGEFTINIALIEQHTPKVGVVHIPVTGITYFATKGHGAFKILPGEKAKKIKVRPTQTDNITVAGSRSHGNDKQQAFINALENIEVIAIGSSLKFCLLAEGKVDIYPRFGPTSEWDTAAAQCIVEEAGGTVTDTSLEVLRYNTKESLINPDFLVIADSSFNWKKYLP
jgi:3'(2'), 5'-bisphosphate nucleotidase